MKNIFILTFAFLIAACQTSTKKEVITEASDVTTTVVSPSDAQLTSAGIVLAKLEQKALSSVIITNGTIDVPPQNMISVSIPLGGYLTKVHRCDHAPHEVALSDHLPSVSILTLAP